jgi:hypothetical protein
MPEVQLVTETEGVETFYLPEKFPGIGKTGIGVLAASAA